MSQKISELADAGTLGGTEQIPLATGGLNKSTTPDAVMVRLAPVVHAATSKTTPVDADEVPLADSAASFVLKKLTWANVKTALNSLYEAAGAVATHASLTATHGATGAVVGTTNTQTLTNKTINASSNTVSNLTTSMFASNVVDNDSSLTANSSSRIPTQAAVKAYADALIAANDAMVFEGVIDCSANPNYPAADRGHAYKVSVAGKIGGASGTNVEVNDLLLCTVDGTAAGTQAAVGANWQVIQANIDGAVTGPASSTSGNIATFNGTGGKVIQDGGKALPSGTIVGTTDSQTLTNKTLTSPSITTPTGIVKGDVGLGNVDNTSDATKNAAAVSLTNKNLTSGTNTFPTFNQNTTGSAATLTTSRNIDGQAFNGSADITVIAPGTHAATSKATPVDADEIPLADSAASFVLKKLTWANLKATLKTYLDTLYEAIVATRTITTTSDTLVASDRGKTIIYNSASAVAVAVTAAATLGDGWYCDIININSGVLTIDPNSTETIDGNTTASVWKSERFRIVCNGSTFYTLNHGGDWVSYTPTMTPSGGGTFTTTSASGVFKKVRTTVMIANVTLTLTDHGTGTGNILASLPVTPSADGTLMGLEIALNGKVARARIFNGGANVTVGYYDNTTTAGTNGATFVLGSCVYQCAA